MRILITISAIALTACASTPERRIVKVAGPTLADIQTVNYVNPEARAACDTRQMRRCALDNNMQNDTASVTVVRDIVKGTRTMTDIEVNCRDYFANRLRADAIQDSQIMPNLATSGRRVADPTMISGPSSLNPSEVDTVRRRVRAAHTVAVGETLSNIARQHCVTVSAIRDVNNLTPQTQIYAEDVLMLPLGSC